MSPLERYRPLIDDFAAFRAAAGRPLATCVVANQLRISAAELAGWLRRDGYDPEPVAFMPGAFLVAPEARISATLAHRLGLLHIQEAVATLPVALLDPRPGERVLDLCAAPGNKTAQIAQALDDRGTVVAVDRFQQRIGLVRQNAERLGHTATVTLLADGVSLSTGGMGRFDRVLVDVPCSCEGTSRKNPRILGRIANSRRPWRSHTQRDLLRKAVQLCRPGGRIAYATCTYAPEQNEAVIAAVLAAVPEGTLLLIPADLPGVVACPGLTSWQGERFPDSMVHARRIYPHQNDTGGFFVALLEKSRPLPREATDEEVGQLPALSHAEAAPFVDLLTETYGIPAPVVEGFCFLRTRRHMISLAAAGIEPPAVPDWHTIGISAIHTDAALPYLTTQAALRLGGHATRNVVELESGQRDTYLGRDPQPIRPEQRREPSPGRPVIVRHAGLTIGLGRLAGSEDRPLLESLSPR